MARLELHIGSAAFWERAAADIAGAQQRVLIQAMTFEGDSAGQAVAEALAASLAGDRRVLVDDYTRHVINDRFLAFARDPALLAEAGATWAMFDRMRASGTGMRLTNPVGGNWLRYPLRNHKKLLVMDGVAWLGGINFSDHNFAWHDMMLRIDDPAVTDWLAGRFDADWRGEPAFAQACFPGVDLVSLDGRDNAAGFRDVLEQFRTARRTIEVVSAYPTFPFVKALGAAARRGVAVTIYTPRPNNKPIIRDYLLGMARGSSLEIRLLPDMTHVKAALIDGESLIAGSSNFDFVSHRVNAEYLVTIRDPALIADFEVRLLGPARASATPPGAGDYSRLRAARAGLGLRIADRVISVLPRGPAVTDWEGP